MARRPRVHPEVRVYEFPNHARWAVRIDAGTHVFIGLYRQQPSRARPTPVQVEMYRVRRGLEEFLGYAEGEEHVRLARCCAALVDGRLLVWAELPGRTVGSLELVTHVQLSAYDERKVPVHCVG